jgi:hypothetical protein
MIATVDPTQTTGALLGTHLAGMTIGEVVGRELAGGMEILDGLGTGLEVYPGIVTVDGIWMLVKTVDGKLGIEVM